MQVSLKLTDHQWYALQNDCTEACVITDPSYNFVDIHCNWMVMKGALAVCIAENMHLTMLPDGSCNLKMSHAVRWQKARPDLPKKVK